MRPFNWRGRLPVAVLLLALVAAAIQFHYFWIALTLPLAVVAAHEWAKLCGFQPLSCRGYAALFAVAAALGQWLLFDAAESSSQALWTAALIFWIAPAPLCLLAGRAPRPVLLGALGMTLLFAAWHAAVALRDLGVEFLLVGMAAVWLFDVAAFVVGRIAGKTPIAPTVSPKKTLEGQLGGTFAVFAAVLLYQAWRYDAAAPPLAVTLAIAFALVALATLGDLFESFLKRRAKVKDSGVLFGAHGGVLDRVDALLPVLPFVALLSPWLA